MQEFKPSKLMDVFGRDVAELIVSYLRAHGIEAQLFQESIEVIRNPITFGRVEIFVPNFQLDEAQKLYEASGWDFDATETDEEDFEDEESDSPTE